jgi:hypothetical protein
MIESTASPEKKRQRLHTPKSTLAGSPENMPSEPHRRMHIVSSTRMAWPSRIHPPASLASDRSFLAHLPGPPRAFAPGVRRLAGVLRRELRWRIPAKRIGTAACKEGPVMPWWWAGTVLTATCWPRVLRNAGMFGSFPVPGSGICHRGLGIRFCPVNFTCMELAIFASLASATGPSSLTHR